MWSSFSSQPTPSILILTNLLRCLMYNYSFCQMTLNHFISLTVTLKECAQRILSPQTQKVSNSF